MIKVRYEIEIEAPANLVYDRMLGLSDKSTYEQWTAPFNPTSSWEGSWEKGQRIYFIGLDSEGKKSGMVSEIAENRSADFVSIRHLGMLKDDQEITTGPEVEPWAGSLEEYSFHVNGNITRIQVELDTSEDFVQYMDKSYPIALQKLKEICESDVD